MKTRDIHRKLAAIVVSAIFVCATALGSLAYAQGSGAIEVDVAYDGTPLSQSEVKIWHVSAINSGTLLPEFTVDFEECGVKELVGQEEDFASAVDVLLAWAQDNNRTPFATAVTNTAGKARFDGLDDGYWLVYVTVPADDTYSYETIPSLVFVQDGTLKTTAPKISRTALPEKVTYMVQKVWKDGDPQTGVRPQEVEIAILKDGNEYEVVRLNDSNAWKYEWTVSSDEGAFTVAERNIAPGYTVEISRDGTTFVVINSRDVSEPPAKNPPQKVKTPFAKTGDENSFVVGIALGTSAVSLLVWTLVARLKKRTNFGA